MKIYKLNMIFPFLINTLFFTLTNGNNKTEKGSGKDELNYKKMKKKKGNRTF
jgi:hypothetical protein